MLDHLSAQGLHLHLKSSGAAGDIKERAFFTRSAHKNNETLNRLFKAKQRIEEWQGIVSCERFAAPTVGSEFEHIWGDCCLVVGPFVFFGDRELLSEIREALNLPEM